MYEKNLRDNVEEAEVLEGKQTCPNSEGTGKFVKIGSHFSDGCKSYQNAHLEMGEDISLQQCNKCHMKIALETVMKYR